MNKHMQEQKQKYIKKQITKQELANKLHQIFASHIQKVSQDILGETSAYLPDPDKPPPTKNEKETYLDHVSPESRALHKKISDIIKATQLAITLRKPQSEIDQLYIQVAEARNQYKQLGNTINKSKISNCTIIYRRVRYNFGSQDRLSMRHGGSSNKQRLRLKRHQQNYQH